MIKEANTSGYYHLVKMNGSDLMDSINDKWLKHYYAKVELCNFTFFIFPPNDCPCKGYYVLKK